MIRVLKDQVALRQLETLQSMSELLIIPESVEEGTRKCEVVAVGPGYTDECGKFHGVDVNVGDLVYCSRYGGQIITTDKEIDTEGRFLIVKCNDIIGVFAKSKNSMIEDL